MEELLVMRDTLVQSGLFKVQQKIQPRRFYNPESIDENQMHVGSVLDVETTGLDVNECEMINIAMVQFTYDMTGRIHSVVNFVDEFQQPKDPIPEQASKVNGITDERVKGKAFNMTKIRNMINSSEILIAHQAQFDRRFMSKVFPEVNDKIWCCTLTQVEWEKDFGLKAKDLSWIGTNFGFFFDAHLALPDCWATLEILNKKNSEDQFILSYLLDTLNKKQSLIKCIGSPFPKNNDLKSKDYHYSGDEKCWIKTTEPENVDVEMEFLKTKIYSPGACKATATPLNRVDLFK